MGHVFIASGAGQEALARTLAAGLEQHGFPLILGAAATDPRQREARCTIVIWSGEGEAFDALRGASEAASRYNVLIPVRAAGYPARNIPERFARVRPDVIADPTSKSPLALEDPDTIARVIAPLWQLPAVPEQGAASRIESHVESGLTWVFLPAVAWLVFCLLVALGIDTTLKHYNPYADVRALNQDAAYVSARRRNMHRLEWLTQDGERITLARQPATPLAPGQEITILVHGYNIRSRAIGNYFDDMISHLRGGGTKNLFIVYDWPSGARASETLGPFAFLWTLFNPFVVDTVATEAEMYNLGRENARGRSSDAFADLVEFVHAQTGRKVSIVAHSMGCYLVLEAIRKRSTLSAKIGRIGLLAPAVPYDALEQPAISAALENVGKVFVFHSTRDAVLAVYASFRHASPMLGAIGPRAAASLPKNIAVYNIAEQLRGRDIHGQYLRSSGLAEIKLVKLLNE